MLLNRTWSEKMYNVPRISIYRTLCNVATVLGDKEESGQDGGIVGSDRAIVEVT